MPAPGNKSPDGRHCSGNGVQHIVGYKNMLLNPFVQCFHVKIIITLLVLLLRGGSVVGGGNIYRYCPPPTTIPLWFITVTPNVDEAKVWGSFVSILQQRKFHFAMQVMWYFKLKTRWPWTEHKRSNNNRIAGKNKRGWRNTNTYT